MKNLFKFPALLLFCALLVVSCDEDDEIAPQSEPASNFNMYDYFSSNNERDKQRITFDASDTAHLEGEQGTLVNIPPYSIVNLNGDTVYGNVTLELLEVYSKADMVRHGKPSVDVTGMPLISDGEVWLNVMKDNQQLDFRAGTNIELGFASKNGIGTDTSTLYIEGTDQGNDCASISGPNGFPWLDTEIEPATVLNDSILVFGFPPTGPPNWYNADYPIPHYVPFTSFDMNSRFLNITVPKNFDKENIIVMTALVNEKSTFPICPHPIDSLADYNRFRSRQIPLDEELTVFCLIEKDGKLYADFVEHKVVNSNIIALRPQEMSVAQFEAKLDEL